MCVEISRLLNDFNLFLFKYVPPQHSWWWFTCWYVENSPITLTSDLTLAAGWRENNESVRWKLPCLVAEPRRRNNKSYWNVCLESPVLLVENIPTQMGMLCLLNLSHSHPFLRLYSYYKRNTDHAGSLEIIVHQKHEASLCNKGQSKFIVGSMGFITLNAGSIWWYFSPQVFV